MHFLLQNSASHKFIQLHLPTTSYTPRVNQLDAVFPNKYILVSLPFPPFYLQPKQLLLLIIMFMLKEESNESGTWPRPSDATNRVFVCQSCESSPATFFCKADAASLCTSCDSIIHSANPLARRHQRLPILPSETDADDDDDAREVASWFHLNPGKNINQNNGFLFGVEYLDLVDYNSTMENQFEDQYSQYQRSFGGDGVVPLQVEESTSHFQQSQHNFLSEPHYNYNGSLKDLNHNVSMDISVVPESTASDTTVQHSRTETTYQICGTPTQMAQQLSPVEREARVLRYREKKKTRKFEKTIRYASRKAYAEIRPRIKGRFAKRIDIEADAEQLFSTSLMMDTGYGIVPTF